MLSQMTWSAIGTKLTAASTTPGPIESKANATSGKALTACYKSGVLFTFKLFHSKLQSSNSCLETWFLVVHDKQ